MEKNSKKDKTDVEILVEGLVTLSILCESLAKRALSLKLKLEEL